MAPKMLKEFLGDSIGYDSSSNGHGFNSYPRRSSKPDNNSHSSDPNYFQNLLLQQQANNDNNNKNRLSRSRSRSRAAAEAAVSSFQKLLNAVKSLQYSSSTPSTLPRIVSRRLLGKWQFKKKNNNEKSKSNGNSSTSSSEVGSPSSKIVVVTVKVKDILRWRSFRDLVSDHHDHNHQQVEEEGEDESQTLDTVGPTCYDAPSTTTSSASNSWVDNDFTTVTEEEQELPCCNDDDEGKNWEEVAALDSQVGPKQDYHKLGSEEGTSEQQSPISVLNSPFRDEVSDEEIVSTFDQSLANMERTKQRLLQSIQMFESLAGVHDDDDDNDSETEVTEEEQQPREEDDTINKAKGKGYISNGFRWFEKGGEGLKDKKECLQSMEKQAGQWSKFEEERPELGVDLEAAILNDLVGEVLFDLCG